MSDEQQLERSVLEGKEREELHAIAEALSLKPGSRAKKADLVDQILRATGVDVPESSAAADDKPRRPRASRAKSGTSASGDSDAAANGSAPAAGEPSAETADEQAASSPNGSATESATRESATRESATPEPAPTDAASTGEGSSGAATGREASGGAGSGGPQSDGAQPSTAESNRPVSNKGESNEAESNDSPSSDGAPVTEPRGEQPERSAGPVRNEQRDRNDRGRDQQRPTNQGNQGNQSGSHGAPGNQNQGGQNQGGQNQGGQNQGGQNQGGQNQGGQNQGGQNQGGQNQGNQGSQGNQGQPFDGDPANRRNRRRRGRDRERLPGDRDLQGQGGGDQQQFQGEPAPVQGFLDLRDEGYGFLRTAGYLASPKDIYVSISQVRRFNLRKGDWVEGASRPAGNNEKYPALLRIDTVSGMTPDEARLRPRFEDLTPLFPDQKLRLEVPGDSANVTARIVDLISPIGKGQRGLIVSPPKAGKTTVLKQIAHSIEANNPDVHLIVLLVDERPEEVTDMRRSVKGEVVASTFDRPSEEHTQVAELAIERAKRLVELGKDVVIVLDGITRLARAYNLAQPATGRIMSGGVDSGALYPPKKFFGAARNIEEGGSLTILATALVETGSRMDEVIFEEFKGTGNMELRLDRKLAERRVYPALDVNASSTRHEELLFDRSQLQQVWKLRRVLNALGSEGSAAAGLELLMDRIKSTKSNDEFLAEIAKTPTPNA